MILTAASARQVLERLRAGPALAARPPISYDTNRSAILVRSYYRARVRVPAVMGSVRGAGVYGLSEVGRARFGPYPDITADDLYVDQCFKRSEIEIVGSAPVRVTAPRRTADLLRILRRNYQGKAENSGCSRCPALQRCRLCVTLPGLHRCSPVVWSTLPYTSGLPHWPGSCWLLLGTRGGSGTSVQEKGEVTAMSIFSIELTEASLPSSVRSPLCCGYLRASRLNEQAL